jgi:hypothetical protein
LFLRLLRGLSESGDITLNLEPVGTVDFVLMSALFEQTLELLKLFLETVDHAFFAFQALLQALDTFVGFRLPFPMAFGP